jgi:hypothetical protein
MTAVVGEPEMGPIWGANNIVWALDDTGCLHRSDMMHDGMFGVGLEYLDARIFAIAPSILLIERWTVINEVDKEFGRVG